MTKRAPTTRAKAGREEEILRFSLLFRLQHMGMFIGVIILIITGLPLKYADTRIAHAFFDAVGGVAASGVIHRVGAAILIVVGTFHMGYIAFCADGRRNFKALLPGFKDVGDVYRNVLHFFGFRRQGAQFGRFSYLEKFDYWAVYWGMVVMILTGLMLWFHDYFMSLLPKIYMDVAREAHSDEALLATLAIVIWHFYNVHFNPSRFPGSLTWWHGKMTKEDMQHEHPLEYEQIMAEAEAREAAVRVAGLAEEDITPPSEDAPTKEPPVEEETVKDVPSTDETPKEEPAS